MTTRSQNLAQRCREVFLDGHWIANTNYYDQLSTIPYEKVCLSVNGCNSIAGLTLHIHYYIAGLLRYFHSGILDISDTYSFSSALPQSEQEWHSMRHNFLRDADTFINTIAIFSDDKLESVFYKEEYGTYERNIEAMIEHAYYHLGQMTLLAKILNNEE